MIFDLLIRVLFELPVLASCKYDSFKPLLYDVDLYFTLI